MSLRAQQNITAPILVGTVDLNGWPQTLSASSVFNIYKTMMAADPKANDLLKNSIAKLAAGRINDINSIVSYCAPNAPAEGGAFFDVDVNVVEARVSVAGLVPMPWSLTAQTKMANAFSYKVIKTSLLEFLLTAENPKICFKNTGVLLFSYGATVHELTHFLLKDPFYDSEKLITSDQPANLVEAAVLQNGGEFDAYQAGFSAELVFLKNHSLHLQKDIYKFFNNDGSLANSDGLKNYVIKLYSNYYDNPAMQQQHIQNKKNMIDYQIQILNYYLNTVLANQNSPAIKNQINQEILRLKNISL